MSPQVAARVSAPFFTPPPLVPCTGLGPSTIGGFATPSDGQARIDAEPGCGTTVKLYLPHHHGVVLPETPVVRDLIGESPDDLGCAALRAARTGAGRD
ncbi:hypothetical protein [Methylobacterium pseudosasicola]|uniref:Uncharacterized protein n=1 Tax=Methylobacterium pseudosasicola TaxID=582667 RepID=A0A1I4P890_9HYPH|nr:hypothetical protein [Methylobacterium pseudosasicola]SFM23757.1 hypothetical protein SAMN05192568_102394 [Methylobacterium pseudosasicola]